MQTELHIAATPQAGNEIEPGPKVTARDRAKVAAWLDRGKRERFTEIVLVTPGMAALLLQQNLGNRPLRRSQIGVHMDRLQRGDFILTHQGAAFAKTGVLNDGQHRLTAIVESGIAGPIQLTFGAEREEFQVIDQSRKRGAADMLAILGEAHSVLRASVAKYLYQVKTNNGLTPDPQLVADYAMEIRSAAMDDALRTAQNCAKVTAPTAVAVAHYWISQRTRHSGKISGFWDGFATGEALSGARLRLREWLMRNEFHSTANTSLTCARAAAIIHAWNAYVSGRRTFSTTWCHVIKLPDPT